jgi:D-glycero-D-manno-heptose 1,7-bisphosphate phosphatase
LSKAMSKQKFIILDRDGTIVVDKHYVHKIKDMEFLANAIKGMKLMVNAGYKLIILTNQAGIAKGYFNRAAADKFNDELKKRLRRKGVEITDIKICHHHPDVTGICQCRKPKTGMVDIIKESHNLKPSEAIFIGDKDCDIALGHNCNALSIRIRNKQYPSKIKANHTVGDLYEAFQLIAKFK